jgi:hypothetical protein
MKKIYILILVAAFKVESSEAQLVLTQANYEHVVGDLELTAGYDTVSVLPRNVGQNQVWNFSSITQSTNSIDTVEFIAPSTIPSSSLFPGATLASKNATQYYSFYKSSSSPAQIEFLGYDDVGAYVNYTNTAIQAVWPIAYGSTSTDTYFGPMSGQASGTRGGTLTLTASGAGTVIMPGGQQYTNVLQVKEKTVDVQNDPNSIPSTLTITTVVYSYYRAGEKSSFIVVEDLILASDSGAFSASGVGTSSTIPAAVATGIKNKSLDNLFSVFPNPAKDNLNVVLTNAQNEVCAVQIYNITGSVVKEIALGSNALIKTQINVSELKPGIYFVKTKLGSETAVRKIMIN